MRRFHLLRISRPESYSTHIVHRKNKRRIMGIFDVARIHMVVLASLSMGLLVSISNFEKAWNDVQSSRGGTSQTLSQKEPDKTD